MKKFVKFQPILNHEERIVTMVVSVEVTEKDERNLDFFYRHIECRSIDITSFNSPYEENHFNATVDDEGLLVSGNVVVAYSIDLEGETFTRELAGTVIIGHSKLADEGLEEIGLTDEQVKYVIDNMRFKVLGVTNG